MSRKNRKSINFQTPREKRRSKLGGNSINEKNRVDNHIFKGSDASERFISPSSIKENIFEIPTVENVGGGKKSNTTPSKGYKFKSPSKPLPTEKETQQNKGTVNTQIKSTVKRKKRKSINFVAPKDKRPNIRTQSITGHILTRGSNSNTKALTFNNSTSSISKLSDIPNQIDSPFDSQSSRLSKGLTSSLVQPTTSQKRKSTSDNAHERMPASQFKKQKTSRSENKRAPPNASFTSTKRKSTRRSHPVPAMDRIKDLKVTKKTFEKWKPMSQVTLGFVEDILKSVILNVIAEEDLKRDEDVVRCLTTLKTKVMERLPNLKAPYTKGDYSKMESQNKLSEEAYLENSRELNVLDKKIEEEQRLLETQTLVVVELQKKFDKYQEELEILEREKVHPLIQQTKNVLNLSQLPDDFYVENEIQTPVEESREEKDLRDTLLQLRQNANDICLEKWMDKLTVFTKNIHEHK